MYRLVTAHDFSASLHPLAIPTGLQVRIKGGISGNSHTAGVSINLAPPAASPTTIVPRPVLAMLKGSSCSGRAYLFGGPQDWWMLEGAPYTAAALAAQPLQVSVQSGYKNHIASGYYRAIEVSIFHWAPCLNGTAPAGAVGECPATAHNATCAVSVCPGGYRVPAQHPRVCNDGEWTPLWCADAPCPAGYRGAQCEVDIDECAEYPAAHGGEAACLNGATCNNLINAFTCTCPTGFMGARCDQCAPTYYYDYPNCRYCSATGLHSNGGCQRKGTCDARGYCACDAPWAGDTCEECLAGHYTDWPTCTAPCDAAADCSGNGRCKTLDEFAQAPGSVCVCDVDWTGADCATRNYCGYTPPAPAPCNLHGSCVNTPQYGNFSCTCLPGFVGDFCETALPCPEVPMGIGMELGECEGATVLTGTCSPRCHANFTETFRRDGRCQPPSTPSLWGRWSSTPYVTCRLKCLQAGEQAADYPCPADYLPAADIATRGCSGTWPCDPVQCCTRNPYCWGNFAETACPTGLVFTNDRYGPCAGNPCTAADCCVEPSTCGNRATCAAGTGVKTADAEKLCAIANSPCRAADACCSPLPLCGAVACPAPLYADRANKATIECASADGCTVDECCAPTGTVFCDSFSCGAGEVAKAGAASLACAASVCTGGECCDALQRCDDGPFACGPLAHFSPTVGFCAGVACQWSECCAANEGCGVYSCPTDQVARAGAAEVCAAAACTEAECCEPAPPTPTPPPPTASAPTPVPPTSAPPTPPPTSAPPTPASPTPAPPTASAPPTPTSPAPTSPPPTPPSPSTSPMPTPQPSPAPTGPASSPPAPVAVSASPPPSQAPTPPPTPTPTRPTVAAITCVLFDCAAHNDVRIAAAASTQCVATTTTVQSACPAQCCEAAMAAATTSGDGDPAPADSSSSSSLPIIIGGAAGGLVLLGVATALARRGGGKRAATRAGAARASGGGEGEGEGDLELDRRASASETGLERVSSMPDVDSPAGSDRDASEAGSDTSSGDD